MFTPRALAPTLALTLLAGPASADPRVQGRPLATAPAAPVAVSPSEEFAARVGSALKDARSPKPQGAASLSSAPLTSRVGVDVRFKVRPGVGSAMEIRGERLQNAHGTDLATAQSFLSATAACCASRILSGSWPRPAGRGTSWV
jgi:hypothetical protein